MPNPKICADKIRILDFDGSVLEQNRLLNFFCKSPNSAQIIDFKDIAPSCRYMATSRQLSKIKHKLENTLSDAITFYGSGDFHHISSVLISQVQYPVSVIVFDNHPDWDTMSPCISCGSWIREICKMDNVKKVILLGQSSNDLSTAGMFTAYFKGIKNRKLEIFPYERNLSRVYFHYLKSCESFGSKCDFFGSTISWNNLRQKNINFLDELLKHIPTENVYVSIDKDCLMKQYALTNWEEGLLPLEWLLKALSAIKSQKNIVGMDITGEYSPILIKNPLKKFLSFFDHPKQAAKSVEYSEIISTNETTNLKILELFSK